MVCLYMISKLLFSDYVATGDHTVINNYFVLVLHNKFMANLSEKTGYVIILPDSLLNMHAKTNHI